MHAEKSIYAGRWSDYKIRQGDEVMRLRVRGRKAHRVCLLADFQNRFSSSSNMTHTVCCTVSKLQWQTWHLPKSIRVA